MHEQEPSRTARAAAAYRAAHQVLDQGRIFADPLALTILGETSQTIAETAQAQPEQRGMRFFIVARSEIAESVLKAGIETRGVTQLVVLGAGLDTFAYRNPFAGRLRVFEVDHPATQAWKQRRLNEAGIAAPPSLVYAPVDFERDLLLDVLQREGFDPAQRTFFMWLGVVPYLTRPAIHGTLSLIAGLEGGAEVVFDYADPPDSLSDEARAAHEARAARVAALGEPFLSYFEPAALGAELAALGFGLREDFGPQALLQRYFGDGAPPRPGADRGGHVIFAAT